MISLNMQFILGGVFIIAFGLIMVGEGFEILGAPMVAIGIVMSGAGSLDALMEHIRSKGYRL